MEKNCSSVFRGFRRAGVFCLMWVLTIAMASHAKEAASPEASGRLTGFYKVIASNDPQFPATRTREYFLDFGKGIRSDRLSGSVAVSLRENPRVRVRIMSWQYFPRNGELFIGNPYAEGSRNAVAAGVWKLRIEENGAVLQRGNHQFVLRRADPDNS